MSNIMRIGDKVIKNPKTWIPTDFDKWGRGIGIGEVVEPPFDMDEGEVDVRWPKGRCFENTIELIKVEDKLKPVLSEEEEIARYKHSATVGDLLDFIEKHNIPRDSKILTQRIEDVYFEEHNWTTIKKPGHFYHTALDWKNKALDGTFANKDNYPSMDEETIKKLAEGDIEYLKEEYIVIESPLYFKDSKHLFLTAHY